jgi:hypothetical protein
MRQGERWIARVVSMASASMVYSCLLVVVIFTKGVTGVSLTWLIVTLFMMSLGCLLLSLVYFFARHPALALGAGAGGGSRFVARVKRRRREGKTETGSRCSRYFG